MIMSEFCMGDRFGPRCGIIPAEDTKVRFDFLVDSFSFAIRLGVISGGKGEVVM